MDSQAPYLVFCLLEGFLFSTVLRGCPGKELYYDRTAVDFQVVLAYPAGPSVNQTWLFSSSSADHREGTPHERVGADYGESCIRNREFGPLPHVTCVPSWTDESSLCTYHFRLTMELVQPREPTSSLGKSGNIKLMMRVQVAWYFQSLWLSVLSQPNAISQNEAGCPQRIARFPPNILRVCAGIHLYVLPKSPNNTSTCCWHFKIHQICWVTGSKCKSSLDLKNHLFFFSRLYITLEAFPVTQVNTPEWHTQRRNMFHPKIQAHV